MGEFVDKISATPFVWGDNEFSGTGSDLTKDLVEAKFNATMETAENMLVSLVGTDGNGGYLGTLNSIITTYEAPDIPDFSITVPDLSISVSSRPTPDLSGLDTDFPTFDKAAPTLIALPTVDLSGLNDAVLPDDVIAAISWLEGSHDTSVFTDLLARIVNDLQSGATGVDATVEQEYYDRALARQNLQDDADLAIIEGYFSSRGFDLPPLAYAAAVTEFVNGRAMRLLDLNGQILEKQADLAQKNSQFVITAAKDLEAVMRDFTNKKNDRSLDYAKAVAANAIAVYAERVKAYIATLEADKANVEIQVEHLRGVVEYNKGIVEAFKAEAEAYGTIIESMSKQNDAVVQVYKAEVDGYDAETRAISSNQQTQLGQYELILKNADIQLRTAIAEVEAELAGYTAESGLKERVAEAMANIAMQSVASAYGAVNASAGLSHTTGRSESESYGHTESRSVDYNLSNSLSEQHSYDEA